MMKQSILGDVRNSETPALGIYHFLFAREHNRLAVNLKTINPEWDDETVYQQARRINIAQYQVFNHA